VQEGNVFRPTGAVETLEVPETLHALVAARLDGLTPEERRLVQDASVLGKTFTKQGLGALTGLAEADHEQLLASLLRKEVLAIQADPRSPERGQYSFLQDIVKRVAYETISKRERKAKHLAAAQFLSSVWSAEEDEIVEVVAAQYLDAYRVAPDDLDAEEIRAKALEMLVRAAERAASLAATVEAQHAFERALELTDDPLVQAELSERAGTVAQVGARAEEASAHFERSIERFEAGGATHAAARVSARLAEIMWDRGRIEQGLESMNRSFEVLSQEEPDADLAALAAQLGRFMFFAGQSDLAMQRIEVALDLAEGLWLPETLSHALNTKGVLLNARGRSREALALVRYALDVAVEHDKPSAALRAYYNLGEILAHGDRYDTAAETIGSGLTLARRVGNRYWEWAFLGNSFAHFCSGAWSDVMEMRAGLPEEDWSQARLAFSGILVSFVLVNVHRGQLDRAEQLVSGLADFEQSADLQERAAYAAGRSVLLLGQGNATEALRLAQLAFETRDVNGVTHEVIKMSFVTAVEAATELGDRARAEELLAVVEALPPGRCPQFLSAHSSRFHGKLAAQEGGSERVDDLFKGATGLFRELATPFYLAVTQLEHGEWLATQGRAEEAEPLHAEAREAFERLEARPWLERAARAAGVGREAEAVT